MPWKRGYRLSWRALRKIQQQADRFWPGMDCCRNRVTPFLAWLKTCITMIWKIRSICIILPGMPAISMFMDYSQKRRKKQQKFQANHMAQQRKRAPDSGWRQEDKRRASQKGILPVRAERIQGIHVKCTHRIRSPKEQDICRGVQFQMTIKTAVTAALILFL